MDKKVIDEVLLYTNKERTAKGLKELKLNDKLSKVALMKAKDMAEKNYLSHDSPTYGSPSQMVKKNGIFFTTIGENINSGSNSGQRAVASLMTSAEHKENILNPKFEEIGIGYYAGAKPIYVQLFITPVNVAGLRR